LYDPLPGILPKPEKALASITTLYPQKTPPNPIYIPGLPWTSPDPPGVKCRKGSYFRLIRLKISIELPKGVYVGSGIGFKIETLP
jgi:hypothetical protein